MTAGNAALSPGYYSASHVCRRLSRDYPDKRCSGDYQDDVAERHAELYVEQKLQYVNYNVNNVLKSSRAVRGHSRTRIQR